MGKRIYKVEKFLPKTTKHRLLLNSQSTVSLSKMKPAQSRQYVCSCKPDCWDMPRSARVRLPQRSTPTPHRRRKERGLGREKPAIRTSPTRPRPPDTGAPGHAASGLSRQGSPATGPFIPGAVHALPGTCNDLAFAPGGRLLSKNTKHGCSEPPRAASDKPTARCCGLLVQGATKSGRGKAELPGPGPHPTAPGADRRGRELC